MRVRCQLLGSSTRVSVQTLMYVFCYVNLNMYSFMLFFLLLYLVIYGFVISYICYH
jgi:hypothetical protein